MARDHTGNPIPRSCSTSRTPASMTTATTPCAPSDVASSSPSMPSVEGDVVVTTSTSPGRHVSTAAWIIRLSPGWQETVTAEPAATAPSWIGRIRGANAPRRPSASCTVETPSTARPARVLASVRGKSRTTTWVMTAPG
jgi:hypothetical protein